MNRPQRHTCLPHQISGPSQCVHEAVAAWNLSPAREALALINAAAPEVTGHATPTANNPASKPASKPASNPADTLAALLTSATIGTTATPSAATPVSVIDTPATEQMAARAAAVATLRGAATASPLHVSEPVAGRPATPSAGRSTSEGTSPGWDARRWWVLTVVFSALAGIELLVLILGAPAGIAHAADGGAGATSLSLTQVINNIRNWVMAMLVSAAVLVWTVAGFRYLCAGGEPEEVAKAKAAFKNGAYGFALAALAPAIVAILKQVCGVS